MKSAFRAATGACALAGLLGFGVVSAQAAGTQWDQLTPEQRAMLQQAQQERWNSMSSERQQRMLEGIERWQKMSPQEREKIRREREKFRSMPQEERARLRERHQQRREAFKRLPPERQQAIRDCWERRKSGEDLDCRSLMPRADDKPGPADG